MLQMTVGETMVWFIITAIVVVIILGGGVLLATRAANATRSDDRH